MGYEPWYEISLLCHFAVRLVGPHSKANALLSRGLVFHS
jgi:hypothetical protein